MTIARMIFDELTSGRTRSSAAGAAEDSPALQRWVGVAREYESPGDDRDKACRTRVVVARYATAEAMGYFVCPAGRDFSCCRSSRNLSLPVHPGDSRHIASHKDS